MNNSYVSINATARSLEALPQTVVELNNVPAYRASVLCYPDFPERIDVMRYVEYRSMILVSFNNTGATNNTHMTASYSGTTADIQAGDVDRLSYVAFPNGSPDEVYLGHLERFKQSDRITSSAFGSVRYTALNMTEAGFEGTQSIMTAGGLRCVLNSESGLSNATRLPSNASSIRTWVISSTDFPNRTDFTRSKMLTSRLAWLQTGLNFRASAPHAQGSGQHCRLMGGQTGGDAMNRSQIHTHPSPFASYTFPWEQSGSCLKLLPLQQTLHVTYRILRQRDSLRNATAISHYLRSKYIALGSTVFAWSKCSDWWHGCIHAQSSVGTSSPTGERNRVGGRQCARLGRSQGGHVESCTAQQHGLGLLGSRLQGSIHGCKRGRWHGADHA